MLLAPRDRDPRVHVVDLGGAEGHRLELVLDPHVQQHLVEPRAGLNEFLLNPAQAWGGNLGIEGCSTM